MATELVKFTLNGAEVSAPKGSTIMEVAHKEGVKIPHFCWHPGLEIAGVCRFCMVEIEGRPKLEIACNTPIAEGMVVHTESSKTKDAHKWALEFHLINHPLDCPICDQAGECGLQDYYMEVGQYESQVSTKKVLKPKALTVGSELILDTERCILCSRCVRFEKEVTKTGALGIFDRGDRAIIGTYGEEQINHNYQENLVDICPVGAFTSRSFRFKQRVWFLKEKESICPGCSTGCAVNVHARPDIKRYFRVKPQEDKDVNGFWMCDKGRKTLEHLNPEERLGSCYYEETPGGDKHPESVREGLRRIASKLKQISGERIALLVSAQYTNEEYEAFFSFFMGKMGVKEVYLWREPTEKISDYDGILLRGDHNPNTQGLSATLARYSVSKAVKNEFDECLASGADCIIALSPEVPSTFPSLRSHLQKLVDSKKTVVLLSTHHDATEFKGLRFLVPLRGFAEKTGTYTNYEGKERKLKEAYPSAVSEALCVKGTVETLASFL